MSSSLSSRLTFGVEIEMVIELAVQSSWPPDPSVRVGSLDIDTNDQETETSPLVCHVLGLSWNMLHQAGIPVHRGLGPQQADCYSTWSVVGDISIAAVKANAGADTRLFGLELVSPKLLLSKDSGHQIDKALSALRAGGAKLYMSKTCALRVHIGLEDNSRLPLAVTKRFASMVMTHEFLIERTFDRVAVSFHGSTGMLVLRQRILFLDES
jgi:hypothetical protein